MNMTIYFRDTRTATVAGCTGNPTEVDATILNGYYRDIYSLDPSVTGLHFPGTVEATPKTVSRPLEGLMSGGIVPSGEVTIERFTNDIDGSEINVSAFKVSVSDEIGHEPLRQVQYQESYWAFPYSRDGVSGNAYFRKAVVDGWGPEPDDD